MDDYSSAVSGAARSIASSLVEEAKYLYGVEDHIGELVKELNRMVCLLQYVDVNPHLVRQDPQLGVSIQKIRELGFRAEDAIDTYLVDARAHTMKNSCLRVISCYPYFLRSLIKEIEAIQKEINDAAPRFQTFGAVIRPSSSQQGTSHLPPIPERYIYFDDQVVVGIDEDIRRLVQKLTNPEDDFRVLGIVGTAGAGKTTLAAALYRHNHVVRSFLYKAFVSISPEWSRIDLLRQIFKQLKGEGDWIHTSEIELAQELYYFMKNKPCLIVLDNIWDKESWDVIYHALPSRTGGSRFILTTRKEELPLHADSKCIIHNPQPLTEDQMWELFSKVAMEGRSQIENNVEFEMLGRQMLAKCGGLPLAVVTLAGILRTKQDLYQWEYISEASVDGILTAMGPSNYGAVQDILELSYRDLPSYFKPCFLYLAIIPDQGGDIVVQTLTKMWIAEGFITDDLLMEHEILEDVATQLLEELVSRSILQVTSTSALGHIERCSLHVLMQGFCIRKAKENHFFEMVSSTNTYARRPSQQRRIAISSSECSLEENHHLRTLVQFDRSSNLESIEKKFKLLRVLNIWGVEHVALPKHIGNLVLLRYLGINASRISKLPKSVRNLRKLLYIDILSPGSLQAEDPIHLLHQMENLRGVVLPHLVRGSFNSLGLNHSKNLQSLISGAGKWMTKELPTLHSTLRNLAIYEIEEMEEFEAIYGCPAIIEDHLLTLECDYKVSGLEFDLKKLMHSCALRSLELHGLLKDREKVIQFPPNLMKLSLSCSRIEERPDLMQVLGELHRLKYLSLSYGAYLGMQLCCTATRFPMLQELHLSRLYNLEEWRMEEGAMPRVKKIEIEHCHKLKKLHESVRFITTLRELQITSMPEEFCKRLGAGGEDSYIIGHVPSLKIAIGRL